MKTKLRRWFVRTAAVVAVVVLAGFLIPQPVVMPVDGATPADWNPESFWYYPWGQSIVHRGIDIFALRGRSVVSATPGIVMACGAYSRGGNVVVVAGPRWRLHYYAHLSEITTHRWARVRAGTSIGTVGDTGNAAGKPAHLHYTILTLVPYPWRIDGARLGALKAFYLDPGAMLVEGRKR